LKNLGNNSGKSDNGEENISILKFNFMIGYNRISLILDVQGIYEYLSERWVVCLCNEPMAVQSARHDSRLKFLPIT